MRVTVITVSDNPDGDYYKKYEVALDDSTEEALFDSLESILIFGLVINISDEETKIIPEHCIRSIVVPARLGFRWRMYEERP